MDRESVDLSTRLGRIKLKNPVLVASGTFGYGKEYSSLVDLNKLGGIITKSLTLKPRPGNPPPRLAETPAGLLNSIGLENPGVEYFIKNDLPFLKKLNTALIVSIAGESEKEYLKVAENLQKENSIDALEINVSCPNVKMGGYITGKNPHLVFSLVKNIKKTVDFPLIVKLTPEVTDIVEIAEAAIKGGAEVLSLINTIPGMAVDTVTHRPKLGSITGGLSGPAIKPVAVRAVWEVYRKLNIPIIGMGGIMCLEDVVEFVLAGASAVAIGTANFIDPETSIKIIDQLKNYMFKEQIKRFSDLIGQIKI